MPAESASSEPDNSAVKPVQCTLVIPRDQTKNAILLAKKARGFGVGKWMGFGGKVESGETIDAATLREVLEETGVALEQSQLAKIGLLLFSFKCKPGYFLEVHVYETFALTTIPKLCDEFEGTGVWFTRDELPYEEMWPDFSYWSDQMFRGTRFRARFCYEDYGTVMKSRITPVGCSDSEILAAPNWFVDTNDTSS